MSSWAEKWSRGLESLDGSGCAFKTHCDRIAVHLTDSDKQ